jgi:PAS domain S-box-containing protein
MLKKLFVPAIAMMNRMNFAVKFVVIGVFLLLPFAYVTHLMSKGSDKQIIFNEKEGYGVDYITPAFRLLSHLQDCRTYSAAILAGETSFRPALEKEKTEAEQLIPTIDRVDAKYREAFRTDDGIDACSRRWAEIRHCWAGLRGRDFKTQEESFTAYTGVCSLVTDWILNYAANYSNLILDPDLDSYWLMDAFVGKLPQITEDVSQAAVLSIGALSTAPGRSQTMDERLSLFGLTSDANSALDAMMKVNFKTAYDYNTAKKGALKSRLDRLVHEATDRSMEFLDTIKNDIVKAEVPSSKPAHLVRLVGTALDATYALYEHVGPELNDLIQARVVSYRRDKTQGLIASEIATFLHVYLFIAFYLSIHASVARVAGFTRRMIAGTEEHFVLDSRDELAKVADSYNQINATLIQTRALKAQVELRTEDLEASEARFRTLSSHAPVGIFMTDARGDCEYVNERWCKMGGLTPEVARGKGWVKALHPDDRERVIQEWDAAARSGRDFSSEYRFAAPDGTVTWMAGNAVTLTDRSGAVTGFLGSVADITERKRVERLKNEFISTVSHELRTPLTSIRGSLGLIAGGVAGDLTPKAKSMIDIAKKNCERLVRLVSDILDIEKIESGKMVFSLKPLDLIPLLDQAVDANRAYAQAFGVTLRVEKSLAVARIVADTDRLTQVLTNLISNAAKFSSVNDAVTVSLAHSGSMIRVSVTDQGAGIPEEFQQRIFQKFAQADASDGRAKQGTGLGLSICKAIVEKMGGQIGFKTAKGAGTTFYFDLPEEKSVGASLPPPHQPNRPTVLVCEDDADIATVLMATLDNAGYNVDLAVSAAQAKDLLARSHYDGMTLDIAMPGQDGISLVRELREETATRNLPIVIVSAYMEEGRRSLNGEAFGIIDWLEKPIDEERLKKALGRATHRVSGRKASILHVEDDPDITDIVKESLSGTADVVQSGTLKDARLRIASEKYDLIILDIGLPDGSGLELLPVLRGSHQASIPVLIFSAQDVSPKTARHVAASLLKSRTSNEELIGTIKELLGNPVFSDPAELARATP